MGIATSQHLVGNPGRSGSVFIEPFRPRHAVPQKSGCADKLAHRQLSEITSVDVHYRYWACPRDWAQ